MTILSRISKNVGKRFALSALVMACSASYAQEKPASLVLKESFGSDPYQHVAYNDGTLVVTGQTGAGNGDGSPNLDILQYNDDGFTLQSQFQLSKEITDTLYVKATDIKFHNGHWVILIFGSPKQYLLTASVENGNFSIVNKLEVDIPSENSTLVAGEDDNIYIVSNENALAVTHYTVDDTGSITENEKVTFGIAPNEPSYRDDFSASYDNNALYLTSNQDEESAGLYRLPLGDNGEPLEAVRLTLNDAKSKYHTSKVVGDLWFLAYHFWGLQVAQIEDDQLTVIFEHSEDSWYSDFEVKDNLVIGIDTFSKVDVFEIGEGNVITHVSKLNTEGFSRGAVLAESEVFYTQDYQGIGAAQISDNGTLSFLSSFSQSGQVVDFAMQGNELATAAFDNNLHFWTLDDSTPAVLTATYNTINNIQGVEWQDDKVVINQSARFETHNVGNMKNNVDVGIDYDNLGSSGRDGQIVKLENGYLAQAFERLNFIDSNNQVVSFIEFETSNSFNYVQEIVVEGNLAFVPLLNPAEVVIYDTSDLSNVVELSRISRSSVFRGNTAVKGNYLYIPTLLGNGGVGITPYDITDPTAPVEQLSVRAGESGTQATLYIDGDFLVSVGESGALFDISEPSTPVLIDENLEVTSSGIGAGYGKEVFTVAQRSAGYMHRSQINLAPTHPDVSLSLEEDGRASFLLAPSDNENDAVSYEVVEEPSKGSISVDSDNNLVFEGATNLNGVDSASLLVIDSHGGASAFSVSIDITPINDVPVIVTDSVSAIEDVTANTTIVATDVDSEDLVFSIKTQPSHGEAQIDSAGVFTYLAEQNFNGEDSLEVEVADEHGGVASKIITLTVAPENDLPEFTGETSQTGEEDNVIAFNLSASDVDGDEITYEVVTLPSGWNTTVNDDVLEVTPQADDNGNFNIVIAVKDSVDSIEQTLTVSLTAVNDAPTFSDQSVNVSATSGQSQTVSLDVTDVDGDTLTYEVAEGPSQGTVTVSAQGVVTYTANANVTGSDSFAIRVTDAEGETATKTVSVNISAPRTSASSSDGGGGGSLHWLTMLALALIAVRRRS